MTKMDGFHTSLEKVLSHLDKPLGDFQYLLYQIDQEIEMLSELRGEVNERMENVAKAIDLNARGSNGTNLHPNQEPEQARQEADEA